jgi:xanthine dehydrogenase accessory factor
MQDLKFPEVMGELASKGKPFAVATVVKTVGSTLAKQGFKVVIDEKGDVVYGTLGGACPEGAIVDVALDSIKKKKPRLVKVFLEDVGRAVAAAVKTEDPDEIHVETNCGGNMEIFVDPYTTRDRLVVVSDGGRDDVAFWLVKFGRDVGFEVHLIDPSASIEGADFSYKEEDLSNFDFRAEDYVAVVTRGRLDVSALKAVSKAKCKFVGLMASRTRIKDDFEKLRGQGVGEEFLSSIHAPVGADIGAQTPQEIAASIIAELVAVKHGKHLPHKP